MSEQSILCVFAHPDDESFGVGGALATYARNGTAIDLVCATRGQAGQLGDPPVVTREQLGAVREAALRDAMQLLGFRNLSLLDYEDGKVADVPYAELLGSVMEHMLRIRPTTVISFGPHGISDHPDHIALFIATTEAFWCLRGSVPELQRLYYPAVPYHIAKTFNRIIPGPEGAPNTEISISPEGLEAQIAALAKHAETQMDAREMRQRLLERHPTVAYLYRVEPPVSHGEIGRGLLP